MSGTLKLATASSTSSGKKRRISDTSIDAAPTNTADAVADVAAPSHTAKASSKSSKATASKTETPAAADDVVVDEEGAAAAPAVTHSVQEQFEIMLETVATLTATVRSIQTQLKAAMKDVVRMSKDVAKRTAKASRKVAAKKDGEAANGGVAKPSGFDKPTLLSDTLSHFLGQPNGTRLGRTDVTRLVNAYIKSKDLQDPADKRRIIPDNSLRAVLSLQDDDVLTFFNIQRYIKHNFIKEEVPAVVPAV